MDEIPPNRANEAISTCRTLKTIYKMQMIPHFMTIRGTKIPMPPSVDGFPALDHVTEEAASSPPAKFLNWSLGSKEELGRYLLGVHM